MQLTRRGVLKAGVAAPLVFVPQVAVGATWRRHLVLVELNGGNDGLNTVVPYRDPLYRQMRSKLALPTDQVLSLDERLGLHPALERLMPLWIDRQMAIALGVGYPQPNLSHFHSIDIWETATMTETSGEDGWLVHLFKESRPPATLPAEGLVLGRNDPGPSAGKNARVIALKKLTSLRKRQQKNLNSAAGSVNPLLDHVVVVQNRMDLAESWLVEKNLQDVSVAGTFPTHDFGRQMETAARFIAGGSAAPEIKCSLDGFDIHAGRFDRHHRLLTHLVEGLSSFAHAMKQSGMWDEVLVMTYAEFGHRPRENDSGGTDHGTAAPHLILGGRVRGGFYGEQPPLDRLEGQNLAYRLDFRALYATVARRWWGLDGKFLGPRTLPLIN